MISNPINGPTGDFFKKHGVSLGGGIGAAVIAGFAAWQALEAQVNDNSKDLKVTQSGVLSNKESIKLLEERVLEIYTNQRIIIIQNQDTKEQLGEINKTLKDLTYGKRTP